MPQPPVRGSNSTFANQMLPPWSRDGFWLGAAAAGLIFTAHILFGAVLRKPSLWLVIATAILLAACLTSQRLRRDLLRFDGLEGPGLLFGLVILAALWSLTPYVPGGPHPVWAYTGASPGASTIDKSATTLEIIKLLGLGCIFLVGALAGAVDERARAAVDSILLIGAAFAVWAFAIQISGHSVRGTARLEANFLTSNTAGTLFAALLMLALGSLTSRLQATKRSDFIVRVTPLACATAIFAVCLFATASRGAFAGAAAGFLAFGLLQLSTGGIRWSRTLTAGLVAATLAALLLAIAGDVLLTRMFHLGPDTIERGHMYAVHWHAFLASPLMGYGLGTFDSINHSVLTQTNFVDLWNIRAVHNVYLGWLEQGGLIGAAPMFACIALVLFRTVRQTISRSRMRNTLFGLIAVDVAFLVHGMTDFALETYSMAVMWAYLLGLQLSLSRGSANR